MAAHEVAQVLACVGHLALALYAVRRAGESPLARILALLGLDMLVFNGADLIEALSGSPTWGYLDVAASSYMTPLALELILEFTGDRSRLRAFRIAAHAGFALLSAACLAALLSPAAAAFAGSSAWAALLLAAATPCVAVALWRLTVHHRLVAIPAERARTRLVFAAIAITTLFGTSDLWATVGVPIAHYSHVATLTSTALLAVAVLRFEMIEKGRPRTPQVLASLVLAVAVVLVYISTFDDLSESRALLAFATGVAGLALSAFVRPVYREHVRSRERARSLAALGRMSAQLAHDLRNPIAAVKGAAQLLSAELAAGRSLAPHKEFLDLISEQADRLARVVETYHRFGRFELEKEPIAVAPLLERLAAGRSGVRRGATIRHALDLDGFLPEIRADKDLLVTALEDLVQNAEDAMPDGGTVTLRARRLTGAAAGVLLEIRDEGVGMDGPTLGRAFDEFFTTKAAGTGLGLPFARRVVEAHGGELGLTSSPGAGTVVHIRFPGG